MSNRISVFVLLVATLALVAANVVVRSGRIVRRGSPRMTLVEPPESVTKVVLERPGQPAVTLLRDERWHLSTPYVGAVDPRSVMRLIDALSLTPAEDVISDSELLRLGRTRQDFLLENPPLRILLEADGGTMSVSFGGRTPSGDGIYAAVGGQDMIFVLPTNVISAVDVSARGFRRRAVLPLGFDAIPAFEVKCGTGAVTGFSRTVGGWRTNQGSSASAKRVGEFLKALSAAEALDFIWPVGASNETAHVTASQLAGYGLDPESAVTLTLSDASGSHVQISFGKSSGEGTVYALVHGGRAVVTVSAGLREALEDGAVRLTDSRIFPMDAREVTAFSIADGGVACAFSRRAAETWMLESPVSAPADGESVRAVLSRILALTAADVVSSGGVSVSLSTNAPAMTVRRDAVFGRLSPEDLRSREMLRIDPAMVRRIVRIPGGMVKRAASVVYDRERRTWSVEKGGEGVLAKGVESVLSVLGRLVALRVEKLKASAADLDDYGLDVPAMTIALDLEAEGSVRRNVLIGKKTKGGRFVTIGSSDAVFVVGEKVVDGLMAEIVVAPSERTTD